MNACMVDPWPISKNLPCVEPLESSRVESNLAIAEKLKGDAGAGIPKPGDWYSLLELIDFREEVLLCCSLAGPP